MLLIFLNKLHPYYVIPVTSRRKEPSSPMPIEFNAAQE